MAYDDTDCYIIFSEMQSARVGYTTKKATFYCLSQKCRMTFGWWVLIATLWISLIQNVM